MDNNLKKCWKCKTEKDKSSFWKNKAKKDGYADTCKQCEKQRMEDRKLNPEYHNIKKQQCRKSYFKNRDAILEKLKKRTHTISNKRSAQSRVEYLVKIGKLVKTSCKVCGKNENIEGHHIDYSKHEDVIWLCKIHHSAVHHGKIDLNVYK